MQSGEEAGLVMLVGPPEAGKSHVLAALTEARQETVVCPTLPEAPISGTMKFEDIQIQVVGTPPAEHRGKRILPSHALPEADLIAIIVDLSREPSSQIEVSLQELGERGTGQEAEVFGEITMGGLSQKVLIVGNKNDREGSRENWHILHSQYALHFPMIAISARKSNGIAELKKMIYELLDIIRVYCKTPCDKANPESPAILKKDSTVKEAFESMYRKTPHPKLDYGIIWNSSRREGQRVGKRHVLQDKDIVEFHIHEDQI